MEDILERFDKNKIKCERNNVRMLRKSNYFPVEFPQFLEWLKRETNKMTPSAFRNSLVFRSTSTAYLVLSYPAPDILGSSFLFIV